MHDGNNTFNLTKLQKEIVIIKSLEFIKKFNTIRSNLVYEHF